MVNPLIPSLILAIPLAAFPVVGGAAFAAEVPVAAEKNPPGDIPDTQVFIVYTAPAGFSMKVPEGWSRTDVPAGAAFEDKYDSVNVTATAASAAPTVASVKSGEAKILMAQGHAVTISSIKSLKLPGGEAVVIEYAANSDPNPVTGKQIRLERARYFIFKNGKLVTLDLAAPKGADNVDQWKWMSESVRID
ncbi:MAG: hypothetical protein P4M09_01615 [Devosia sp.]|nr:hypothetical protein [Devosia sp.]